MKILRLAQRLPPRPGGLERHVQDLTLTQAGQRMQVELVYAEGEPPHGPEIAPYRISMNGPCCPEWWPSQHRFAWKASRYRRLDREPIRVVHAHGDYPLAWAAVLLGRRFRCPSVLTVHGGLSERPLQRLLSRFIFPCLAHMIAVSDDIAAQLQARQVPRARITVISSGIHIPRFASRSPAERDAMRASYGVPPGGHLIAAVGRLHPVKGYQYLVAAAPQLLALFPDLRIVIAGEGPDEASLRQMARHCAAVRFVGTQSAAQIADLLQAADLFVLPSVDLGAQREGTPTSVMEAMAAGLPVVATHTGGVPHLVADGTNGLIVPPESAGALVHAISCLLGDPAARMKMAARNREAVRDRDWTVVGRQVAEVYDRAAAAEGGRFAMRPSLRADS